MLYKIIMMIFLILIFQYNYITAKDVYVSRDKFSNDTWNCGLKTQPCATIQHAIKVSNNSDTILLDANHEFVLKDKLFIDKNIHITSFSKQLDNATNIFKYSTISFGYLSRGYFCTVSANLSISKIKLQAQKSSGPQILFTLVATSSGYIEMTDCLYNASSKSDGEFDSLTIHYVDLIMPHAFWTINIIDTVFETYYYDTAYIERRNNTTPNSRGMINLHYHVTINFKTCKFIASNLREHYIDVTNFIESEFIETMIDVSVLNKANISNCKFKNSAFKQQNAENLPPDMTPATLNFINTNFTGSWLGYVSQGMLWSGYEFRFQLEFGYQSSVNSLTIKVHIDNCLLRDAAMGAIYLEKCTIKIKNTTFRDNYINKSSLIQAETAHSNRAGALTSYKSYVEIYSCTFLNNSATPTLSGSIHAILYDCDRPCVNFWMVNSVIEAGAQSKEDNVVLIPLPIYTGRVEFDNVSIRCPVNYKYKYYRIVGNEWMLYVVFNCVRCDGTSYNAGDHAGITWAGDGRTINEQNVVCYTCPYQASCIGSIKSKGNYWGHLNSSGGVNFKLCPPSYCCSSLKTCTSYNTCVNNRTGRLCGDCLDGHSISMFGHNRCVLSQDCSVSIFWVFYIVAAILVCLFVMYHKEIITFIKTTAIKKCQSRSSPEDTLIPDDSNSHQLLLQPGNSGNAELPQQSIISGLVKISFFFYQAASIIRINASAKTAYQMPYIIDIITSFFNIKIDVQSSTNFDICAMHTTHLMIVEFLKTSLIFTCCLVLLTIAIVLRCFSRCSAHAPSGLPLMDRIKRAYLQTLLLGYSTVATFCLQAVHCIDIDDGFYLYSQASVECYQPWQSFIIAAIVIWVVPFPLSIYFGCRLLRSYKVTPNQFLLIITFPPAMVWYFLTTHRRNQVLHDEGYFVDTGVYLIGILNEPFRFTEDDNNHRIIWEPVLIIRRLLLVVTSTFILSPIEKLYPIGALLLMYPIHDIFTEPYDNNVLNTIEFISMLVLGLLTLLNTFWSFSVDIDITQNPSFYKLGEVFLILEILILLLPFIFFVVYVLYNLGKFIYKIVSGKQD